MSKEIKDESPQLKIFRWVRDGQFHHKGLLYKKGVNANSAWNLLNNLMRGKTITVPISGYQDYIGGHDLDRDIHKGFTIAPHGKAMYFMMIWHKSGHVTVYGNEGGSRYIDGDSIITIHWH